MCKISTQDTSYSGLHKKEKIRQILRFWNLTLFTNIDIRIYLFLHRSEYKVFSVKKFMFVNHRLSTFTFNFRFFEALKCCFQFVSKNELRYTCGFRLYYCLVGVIWFPLAELIALLFCWNHLCLVDPMQKYSAMKTHLSAIMMQYDLTKNVINICHNGKHKYKLYPGSNVEINLYSMLSISWGKKVNCARHCV
jgi:hypothetical protein